MLCWNMQMYRGLFGTLHPLASPHAEDADGDEGDGEELAHVEWHGRLEVHLDVLGVLDEEAEGEDEGKDETEVEAGAYGLGGGLGG